MSGYDLLGCYNPSYVGVDASAILKGAGGLFSGIADAFGSGGGGAAKSDELKRQEEARRKAEASAARTKMILYGVLGVGAVGGIIYFVTRK